MIFIFSSTLFLAAFLLFSIQPMVGKFLLPILGGSPAVWNTCLVFFQGALLFGYFYTYLVTHRGAHARAIRIFGSIEWIHVCIFVFLGIAIPLTFGPSIENEGQAEAPVVWLLTWLSLHLLLPFFILSATAPLVQTWFSRLNHRRSPDPYFLYAASNAGSLSGLLLYPLLVERYLGLRDQVRWWSVGFIALGVLLGICRAFSGSGNTSSTPRELLVKGESRPTRSRYGWWLFLGAVPTSLMMAITVHISTNIAAVPMLWVLPLAVYLLTFILAFQTRPLLPHAVVSRWLPLALITLLPFSVLETKSIGWVSVPLQLALLFIFGIFSHGELARSRPAPLYLTRFYLLISLGGVIAGLFNAMAAPLLFNSVIEYPLSVIAGLIIIAHARTEASRRFSLVEWIILAMVPLAIIVGIALGSNVSWALEPAELLFFYGVPMILLYRFREERPRIFTYGATSVFLVLIGYASLDQGTTETVKRNFFGIKRVAYYPDLHLRAMYHGSTIHGWQSTEPSRTREPLYYVSRTGPVGDVFSLLDRQTTSAHVGVIGLGIGGIATYFRPTDHATFYELDPLVVELAKDSNYFTFLRDSLAPITTVVGDGRLTLHSASPSQFDVLFVDAFSSDAVPVHLLTREAMRLYFEKIQENGALVVHVSNRYVDLVAVIAAHLREYNLTATARHDLTLSAEELASGKMPSEYIVVGHPDSLIVQALLQTKGWSQVPPSDDRPWSDDYSDLVSVLRF